MSAWDRVAWVDRGSRVSTAAFAQGTDERAGDFVQHFHDDGERCVTAVTYAGHEGSKGHVLVSADPLTVEGSVLAPCGLHGWFRDGKWVTA